MSECNHIFSRFRQVGGERTHTCELCEKEVDLWTLSLYVDNKALRHDIAAQTDVIASIREGRNKLRQMFAGQRECLIAESEHKAELKAQLDTVHGLVDAVVKADVARDTSEGGIGWYKAAKGYNKAIGALADYREKGNEQKR